MQSINILKTFLDELERNSRQTGRTTEIFKDAPEGSLCIFRKISVGKEILRLMGKNPNNYHIVSVNSMEEMNNLIHKCRGCRYPGVFIDHDVERIIIQDELSNIKKSYNDMINSVRMFTYSHDRQSERDFYFEKDRKDWIEFNQND